MASQKKGKRKKTSGSRSRAASGRSTSTTSRSTAGRSTTHSSSSTRSSSSSTRSRGHRSSASKAVEKKKRSPLKICLLLFAAAILAVVVLNLIVILYPMSSIIKAEEAKEHGEYDCIMILGCGLWDDEPSPMLKGRLDTGIALYKAGVCDKLLMTGDHSRPDYNEVGAMKMYAINAGVPADDIYLDHAGYSTYESMKRAERIYGVKKMIVVTQKYHMYRALYDAKLAEIEAYGVCDETKYNGQLARDA
ncbi:MAG: YdcF family protein, partial [Lachnospiraceae bacterium]|nr:YdcF family protein [Lachnospiraceae bacterium]